MRSRQVKLFLVFAIALLAGDVAFARDIPLPRARPASRPDIAVPSAPAVTESDRPPMSAPPMEAFAADPEPASAAPSIPHEPSACQIRIADKIAVIAPLLSFAGPGDCQASDVVKLEAIILQDKTRVAVTPAATLRCPMAEAVANWVREDVATATAALGATLRVLDNYASYDCRGRNRAAGARMSEHGLANAIDIRGMALTNGTFAGLTDRAFSKDFREAMKKSVCARFTTVLGPGSDGHHETHIHLDLAERRGGYRLCQWDVREALPDIPLPRPRPPEAPKTPQTGAQ